MASSNDFLPFAIGSGANVESQGSYSADPLRASGNQPGVALSAFVNKSIRQANAVTSQLAQFTADTLSVAVADDGVPANLYAQIAALFAHFTPSGLISAYGAAAAPSGWHICDGSAVSRTSATYAALFAAIGTTYGVGDGSTTFNLPNAAAVYLRGSGSQTISGITYSETLGTIQGDQMQGHIHQFIAWQATGGGNTAASATATNSVTESTGGPITDGTNGTPRVGTETRPATLVINYIIKL